jgi:hypothetical protein
LQLRGASGVKTNRAAIAAGATINRAMIAARSKSGTARDFPRVGGACLRNVLRDTADWIF